MLMIAFLKPTHRKMCCVC